MAAALYGEGDRTLHILEQELGIKARARGNEVRLVGASEEVGLARKVLEELYGTLREGHPVQPRDVRQAVRMVTEQPDVDLQSVYEDVGAGGGSRLRRTSPSASTST
jgi:phosphate starvation-inducible PhoH-like protein